MARLLLVLGALILLLQQSKCETCAPCHPRKIDQKIAAENENGNTYIDKVIDLVHHTICENQLDPYNGINETFREVNIIGELVNLHCLYRVGDAAISFLDFAIDVDARMSIFDLRAGLTWTTKYVDKSTYGSVDVSINETTVKMRFYADDNSGSLIMTDFQFKLGNILVHEPDFEDNFPGIDEKLTPAIKFAAERTIKDVANKLIVRSVRPIIQSAVQDIGLPLQTQ